MMMKCSETQQKMGLQRSWNVAVVAAFAKQKKKVSEEQRKMGLKQAEAWGSMTLFAAVVVVFVIATQERVGEQG